MRKITGWIISLVGMLVILHYLGIGVCIGLIIWEMGTRIQNMKGGE